MPTISVIVPVYKVEEYLPACIRSILRQTYRDFELILVDDGSPDRSGAICDEFAKLDERIRVIHQKNGGVSKARNTGIEIATGDWITFVDADDLITPRYLESFKFYSSDKSSELIIQGFRTLHHGTLGKRTGFKDLTAPLSHLLDESLIKFGWAACKLLRRSIIVNSKLSFPLCFSFCEDAIFYYQYLLHVDKVTCLSSTRYLYRQDRADSLSKKKLDPIIHWETYETMYNLIKKIYDKQHIMFPGPSSYDILFTQARVMTAYEARYTYSQYRELIQRISHSDIFKSFSSIKMRCSDTWFCKALLLPVWLQRLLLPAWAMTLHIKENLIHKVNKKG